MLAKIFAAIAWIKTVRYYHRAEYTRFLDALKAYENEYSLEPYEITLKAYAMLAADRFAEAEEMFSLVCRSVKDDDSHKGRYLCFVSEGMIHKLNGRDEQAERSFNKARVLSPGSLYTTMLPIGVG